MFLLVRLPLSKFLLSIIFIFLATSTKSTLAESLTKSELDKAFTSAIEVRDLKKIQKLIELGADVNAPISYTVTKGDCDWDAQSSPLMFAIAGNDLEMVKLFLQVKSKLTITLNQALDRAIESGRSTIVKELIKEGANINYVNKKNNDTPLIVAIKNSCPLSEFGSQAQARVNSGWEARKEIIHILLKAGAHINHVNKDGSTALMEAVKRHDFNTVHSLLKIPQITQGSFFGFGQKPLNHADKDGNTALIIALIMIRTSYIVGNSQEYNECVNSQKILKELLETPGIDLYHVTKNGNTAISLFSKLKKDHKGIL